MNNWKEREQGRFSAGEYSPLDQQILDFLASSNIKIPGDHYLHLSTNNKNMVAYTPSEKHGEQDRQISLKLSRYLLREFESIDNEIIKKAMTLFKKHYCKTEIQWARTRDEIRDVYENGPSSCMGKETSVFNTDGVHPCEVYATNDIGVAYIADGDHITARAVCNIAAKEYTKIYGDELLTELLGDAGFSSGDLNNCKLLKLTNNNDDLICPYIDGTVDQIDDDGDYLLIVSNGEYDSTKSHNAGGLLIDNRAVCDNCNNRYDSETEGGYSHRHEEDLCGRCIENDYVWVHVSQYDTDLFYIGAEGFYEYDGEYYAFEALSDFNLMVIDDDVHHVDNVVFSEYYQKYIPEHDAICYRTINSDYDYLYQHDSHLVVSEHETEEYILESDAIRFSYKDGEIGYTLDDDLLTIDSISGDKILIEEANEYTDLFNHTHHTYADIKQEQIAC